MRSEGGLIAVVSERYELETPEAVPITYDLAGIGTRVLAALIDLLVIVSALIVGAIALGLLSTLGEPATTIAIIVFLTFSFVLEWGYFILYETLWNGQTPGKRAMDIRVIRTTGYPIGFPQAVIRNLIRIVEFNAIGLIAMFISSQSRRLGDYAAGTIVVKERQPVTIADLSAAFLPSPGTPSQPELGAVDPDELSWNLEALTSADLSLSAQFLQRAPALEAKVRQRIGDEIATRIAAKIGAREPLDPAQFIGRVLYLREKE